MTTFNNKPLGFIKYSKIENKNPQFIAQTSFLDGNHHIIIWFVESEDKYYATIA